jgi:hypothetical protein
LAKPFKHLTLHAVYKLGYMRFDLIPTKLCMQTLDANAIDIISTVPSSSTCPALEDTVKDSQPHKYAM